MSAPPPYTNQPYPQGGYAQAPYPNSSPNYPPQQPQYGYGPQQPQVVVVERERQNNNNNNCCLYALLACCCGCCLAECCD